MKKGLQPKKVTEGGGSAISFYVNNTATKFVNLLLQYNFYL